jgi:hypothetical protein
MQRFGLYREGSMLASRRFEKWVKEKKDQCLPQREEGSP